MGYSGTGNRNTGNNHSHVKNFAGHTTCADPAFQVIVDDLTNIKNLLYRIRTAMKGAGMDIMNDIAYVSKGAAPFDTGQLEGNITSSWKSNSNNFTGTLGVSSFNRGFDYGALRHDYPFNLGEGSLSKGGVTSNITGQSFSVGYNFAAGTAESNEGGYVDYIEEKLQEVIDRYS